MTRDKIDAIYDRVLAIAEEERQALRDRVFKRLKAEFPGIRRGRSKRGDGPRSMSSGPPLMHPQPKGARFPVVDITKLRLAVALDTLTIEVDREEPPHAR